MTVKNITLLSKEEYWKYESVISKIDCWWWLRSPGFTQNCAAYVGRSGFVVKSGLHVADDVIAVRPALKLNLDPSDSLFWYKPKKIIGTKIRYGNFRWTILNVEYGEIHALCDNFIARQRFDPYLNDWNNSELKHWLETEGLNIIQSSKV